MGPDETDELAPEEFGGLDDDEPGDEGAPVIDVGAPPLIDPVIAVCDVVPEAVPALELEEGLAGELGCGPVIAEALLVAAAEAVFAAWFEVIPSACVSWARLMAPVEGGAVVADAEPAIVEVDEPPGFIEEEEADCEVVEPGGDAFEDAMDAEDADVAGPADAAEDPKDVGDVESGEEAEEAEAFSDDEFDVAAGERALAAFVDDPVEPPGAEFIATCEATELFNEELTPLAEGGDPEPCDDDDPFG